MSSSCRGWQGFIAPEYRARVREVLEGALAGRETANFELPMFTKDTHVRATPPIAVP